MKTSIMINGEQKSPYYHTYDLKKNLKPSHDPAPHQKQSLSRMGKWYGQEQNLGGILALPTGGGKTFVATHFLCRHPLSNGYRILWLAHTHHLLNQALEAFDNAISLVDKSKGNIRARVVSGASGHFRPAHIKGNENVLIMSLQTATRALKNSPQFKKFIHTDNAGAGLFVVFDEAHHAPAPTYRRLLTEMQKNCKPFGLLGLTATPIYSNERKQGWLKRLFPQGIIAQVDAKSLMANGVLARPILEDVRTKTEPEFHEREYEKWISTHRDLPESVIGSLAENQSRNDDIISHYVNNKKKYGKTIMFADRWFQCEYLVEALDKRGIRAGAVYSHVESDLGGADARNRRQTGYNDEVIRNFKSDKLDVLINVRMLTEGTDVPGAQTVFLTRQTTSKILLKQMVGRALRGPKFGGTKDAYIVSFIDNWQQHIDWATYDQLGEGIIDDEQPKYGMRSPLEWISVELVKRLVRQMDSGLNIATAPYRTMVPTGWYQIEYDSVVCNETSDDSPSGTIADDIESVRKLIMVYEHDHKRLERFISRLKNLHQRGELQDFMHTDLERSEKFNKRLEGWRNEVFGDDDNRSGIEAVENLLDLARHVAQENGEPPHFFQFHEHKDHDLDIIASRCIEQDHGPRAADNLLYNEYTRQDRLWRNFYPEYNQFKSAHDACVNRILHEKRHGSKPNDNQPIFDTPENTPEMEPSDDTKKVVKVRDKHRCLCCGSRGKLEVDHVKPKYSSMDHRPENLQTLCRICNRQKGSRYIDFRSHQTPLKLCPNKFPELQLPKEWGANSAKQLKTYLRRSVNFFYNCAAVETIRIDSQMECPTWHILLFQHNDPDWLKSHLPILAKRIQHRRSASIILIYSKNV